MIFKTQSSDKQTYGMQNICHWFSNMVLKLGFALQTSIQNCFIGVFFITLSDCTFFVLRIQNKMYFENEKKSLWQHDQSTENVYLWNSSNALKNAHQNWVQLVHFSHFSWLFTSELFLLSFRLIWLLNQFGTYLLTDKTNNFFVEQSWNWCSAHKSTYKLM